MSIEKLRARLVEVDRLMTPSRLIQVPVAELRAAVREADALTEALVTEPRRETSASVRRGLSDD